MFLRQEINWELKIDEGWGEMGKMWPGSSDSLKKPSLEMTGTWYSPGSFRNLKHEPQSKAGTQGVEKLGCAHTNFRPSPWGLHSCVSAHVCVCTRREVALIPPCFWLALWAVKWALSGWESPQAKTHMLAVEIRQCPLEKSEWRDRCGVMPDTLKMKWVNYCATLSIVPAQSKHSSKSLINTEARPLFFGMI